MKQSILVWFMFSVALVLRAASPATLKPVMVHYMPWYVAKPYSGSWGWHWTMNRYNPEVIDAAGQREIASRLYPAIGPYDSADPVVLEYHVLLMKLAGIDGVIADWYGMDDYLDYGAINQRAAALFDVAQRAGLKFALCYEDRTIKQEVTGGFITASNASMHAQQAMLYAQTSFFTTPGYLRWRGQPVLLNFGPQYFTSSAQWQSIFSVLNATNQPAFFTEDNRLAAGAGAFDWPPMWLSQTNGGVLDPTALDSYLADFERKGRSWPAFISSAFPRFKDIYAQAGVGTSYGSLSDRDGDTLRRTLARAFTNDSAIVQIVTWNDFGEGTVVEPTKQYGYRDLGIIQDLHRRYLDPTFPYRTNDLALATRLYSLRLKHAGNEIVSADLDRVSANIIAGKLVTADAQLTKLGSNRPAATPGTPQRP